MLIGTGIVIAGFTLAMMLVMAIDSALYIMGGILVALSIPLMLMTTGRCWSKTLSALLATSKIVTFATRLNTSQGRINNDHGC